MNNYTLDDVKEGTESIIDGLHYHFENYRILNQSISRTTNKHLHTTPEEWSKNEMVVNKMKHEMIAYFNRLGMFYYFATSVPVKAKIPNPETFIPTIKKFLPFRLKYTAHRAIDRPRDENPTYMNQLNRLFSTQAIFVCGNLVFQMINDSPEKNLHFDLLEEHPKIEQEALHFLEELKN